MSNRGYTNLIAITFGTVMFLFGYSVGRDYWALWQVVIIIVCYIIVRALIDFQDKNLKN